MRQSRFLWTTVSASLLAIGLFPLYTVFVLAPEFEELLVEDTKGEAVRLAGYLSTFVVEKNEELERATLAAPLSDRLRSLRGDGHLVKMRIFSPSGEIIYSSEPTEVGQVNQEAYFRQILADATVRAEMIPNQARSLENEIVPADVVETYVPITRGERLLGVFELYHNVSQGRQGLKRLIYRSYGTLFLMAGGLLVLVLFSSSQAHRSMEERARAEEQLRLLSLTDELTGLYNRRGFLALAEPTRLANRDQKPMMVVSADLDGLKEINDNFGHQEGDAAIVATAHILRTTFRKADIIARIGGDEFALLLTGGEAEFDRAQLDERLRKIVGKYNKGSDRPYKISVSAGFAYFDAEGPHTFEEWLHQADTMMYEQKRGKKGLS